MTRKIPFLALAALPLLVAARPAAALTWDKMTVDFPGMDDGSIAVDASGRPHIAYRDYLNGDLKYGRKNDNASWQVWTVEASGFAGWGLSLALDGAGNPHIAYYTIPGSDINADGDLKYAKGTCTPNGQSATCSFSRTVIEADVYDIYEGGNTSIAIDGAGIPHVGYFHIGTNQLKWARKLPNVGWDKANVTSVADGGHVSLVPDADGLPHMVYEDRATDQLKYVRIVCRFILCGWSFENIDQGLTPAMKRAPNGRVHVAYWRQSQIRYSVRTCVGETCSWSAPQTVGYAGLGLFPGLALDGNGAPVITFIRPEHFWHELVYATRWKFGWMHEVVDQDAAASGSSSITIDGSGRRHVAYPGDSDQSMRYGKGTGSVIYPPTTVFAP